jgi:predicted kinase
MQTLRIPPSSLVVLCGPSGAGKSSWAARRFPPTQVVSSDGCRALVADDPGDQRVSREAFALLHTIVDLRARLGRLTVADSTALQARARRELLAIARRHRRHAALLLFDLPVETCLEQGSRRELAVPREVVREHAAAMAGVREEVAAEGWDQVVRLRSPAEAEAFGVEVKG